jgi:hypothetical protein
MSETTIHVDNAAAEAPLVSRRQRRLSTIAGIFIAFVYASLVLAGPASAAITNPLDAVSPDLSFLGPAFNNVWVRVAGAIWALSLAYLAVRFITSWLKLRAARNGGYAGDMTDAGAEVKAAGVAFGGTASAGLLIGSILFVVQP